MRGRSDRNINRQVFIDIHSILLDTEDAPYSIAAARWKTSRYPIHPLWPQRDLWVRFPHVTRSRHKVESYSTVYYTQHSFDSVAQTGNLLNLLLLNRVLLIVVFCNSCWFVSSGAPRFGVVPVLCNREVWQSSDMTYPAYNLGFYIQ